MVVEEVWRSGVVCLSFLFDVPSGTSVCRFILHFHTLQLAPAIFGMS